MNKALLVIGLILFVFLIMTPIILWINNRSNVEPETVEDLSDESLAKLENKKILLNMLDQWIKENELSHQQIAIKLAVNMKVVSDIVHQRTDNFTIDRLVDLVLKTGKSLKWVITKRDEKA